MSELVNYFQAQRKLRTVGHFLDLPIPASSQVDLDYSKLGTGLPCGLKNFGTLFEKDKTAKDPIKELSPLSSLILGKMETAGYDLESFSYHITSDRTCVVPCAPRELHIDETIELKKYQRDILRHSRTIRAVLSNICSTAIMDVQAINARRPKEYSRNQFVACALALIDRPIDFADNLNRSQIVFKNSEEKEMFLSSVRDVVKVARADTTSHFCYGPSCPAIFTAATLHSITYSQVKAPTLESQERRRIILTIKPT